MKIDIKTVLSLILILLMGVLIGRFWLIAGNYNYHHGYMGMGIGMHEEDNSERGEFIKMKNHMISEMVDDENYRCCLENPCTYCIEKSPGHGEGASCSCLEDVMNGVHPCGECMGEILEGNGNRFIAKYFATAIAEEIGVEHTDMIKKIIEKKYDVPTSEQI